MKYLTVFVILIYYCPSFSQNNTKKNLDLKVIYEFSYTKFAKSNNRRTTNTVLINKEHKALFTFKKMMHLDSLQQFRPLESSELLLYKTPYFFLIKRNNNLITHHESIGNDLLKFNDTLNLDWKLVNEEKIINTYKCKKAVLNFQGKDWIAWYTTKIPVNSGPYKFFGLPGLIINIKDTKNIFEFTAVRIKRGNFNINSNEENYFILNQDNTFYEVKKDEFYGIRKKFYEMSLNERLKYMNREKEEGIYYFDIKSTTGEKIRTNRKSKQRNFIEQH